MVSEYVDDEEISDDRFTHLAELACLGVEADTSLIALIKGDQQVFKAAYNLPEPWASWGETPLSHSIGVHVVELNKLLVIEDTLRHPLVHNCPIIADLSVYAYMGYPIHGTEGRAIGSVCIIQNSVRHWTAQQKRFLTLTGQLVDQEIERVGVDTFINS